mmetsp:Transcript_18703/g.61804  ORF Transcript_18703/g.61804 Transcript_18703/m.61804 type:complete len:328 (+) Transcript_18703:58-1041(+)
MLGFLAPLAALAFAATPLRQSPRAPLRTPLALACAAPLQHPVRVYIEDTDCYGVVFHGNYLRFFERAAMSALVGLPNAERLLRTERSSLGLVSVTGMKCSTAAKLGDDCHVEVSPQGIDAAGRLAYAAVLVRADGKALCSASDLRLGCIRDGHVQDDWPLPSTNSSRDFPDAPAGSEAVLGAAPPAGEAPAVAAADAPLALHVDECSALGTLSVHAAVRYFERHRTQYLGGPDQLAGLADAGVNVVVARLGLRLLPEAHRTFAGTPLELRCRVKLRARGTQVFFEHWLLRRSDGAPLARGDVTCLCIDSASFRIVPAPPVVRERLEL